MQSKRIDADIRRKVSEQIDEGFIQLAIMYAKMYQDDPRSFVQCFIKFESIRQVCAFIVKSFKNVGAFEECLQTGKNFDEWSQKQNVPEKYKRVLSEFLLIIYSITNQK